MIFLIVGATLAYACSIVAFSRGPLHLNSNLFGAIVNSLGASVPIFLYMTTRANKITGDYDARKGIAYAIMGGLAIGAFTLLLTKIFSTGQNVSFVTPLIYGGAVLISSLIGLLLFKEQFNGYTAGGLLLISGGIFAIAYSAYIKGAAS